VSWTGSAPNHRGERYDFCSTHEGAAAEGRCAGSAEEPSECTRRTHLRRLDRDLDAIIVLAPTNPAASAWVNDAARCETACSYSWSIPMLRRITMAARGNYGPRQTTAKSRVVSVPSGGPIGSLASDPTLELRRDGKWIHIRRFSLF
jgi:hypothetical protein